MRKQQLLKSTFASFLFVVIIMGGIYLFYNKHGQKFVSEILKDPELTTGMVKSVSYVAEKGYCVTYDLQVNGIVVPSYAYKSALENIRTLIINKSFPVIYNKNQIDQNTILILPEHFQTFKIVYPDSLKWILNARYR